MKDQQPTGFPFLLVIQIVLAIISYLMRKSASDQDTRQLLGMKTTLETAFPEAKQSYTTLTGDERK